MADIKRFLSENAKDIDRFIEKVIPRKFDAKSIEKICGNPGFSYQPEAVNKAIAEPIWNLLDRGGKRWRPSLFLLMLEALGKNSEDFSEYVAIPEVVHDGSLVVDDIEDGSDFRRGKPCLHKVFGTDVAINAGNTMYFLPMIVHLRNRNKLDDSARLKIYDIYTQEMINIHFGQAMDIAWHRGLVSPKKITEDEYMQMCTFKTGTLARMSAKIAGALAGTDGNTLEKIGKFAETVGTAFQIQDDILNLTAKTGENQFVKDYIGSDITEGKISLMVIHAIHNAPKKDSDRLLEILKMHTKDRKLIEEAISVIKRFGSVEYAKQKAGGLVKDSWKDIDGLLKESPAKRKLKAFADYLVEREF